jgi:hypothetical protein
MTRSQINRIIRDTIELCREMNFHLPPFAYWTADQWQGRGPEYDEIRDNMLGWDVTDFGSHDFDRVGLLLFTIRNGSATDPEQYPKPYCEKLLVVGEDQVTPCHYHWGKVEDIICRAGGNLMVKVWWRDDRDALSDREVQVSCDGRRLTVAAGGVIRLRPGESITLPQYLYHTFWGEAGEGTVLVGEVSKVNDDLTDNRFLEPLPRFADIIEDEPAAYLLCNEYPR